LQEKSDSHVSNPRPQMPPVPHKKKKSTCKRPKKWENPSFAMAQEEKELCERAKRGRGTEKNRVTQGLESKGRKDNDKITKGNGSSKGAVKKEKPH